MNINNVTYLLSLLLLCSSNSFADANYSVRNTNHPWFPLTRASWQMQSIQYPHKVEEKKLTNGFDVRKVNLSVRRGSFGFGLGCNGHGGKLFLLANNELRAEQMMSTQMGCKNN